MVELSDRRTVASSAERVIDADPSRVWALVADPARLGEWAGVVAVGYMGTELPKPGHRVFVRTRRGIFPGRRHRVDIETWEAGSAVSCVVDADRAPTRFKVVIHPHVEHDQITTRVRLEQRCEVLPLLSPFARPWLESRLHRMLDRIGKAALQ